MYWQFDTTSLTPIEIPQINPEPREPTPNPHVQFAEISATDSPSETTSSTARIPRSKRRKLDDTTLREICALTAGGICLSDAARYVRCSTRTIRREIQRNPHFDNELQRSRTYAQLNPLRAMQHAASTHWRAAAWLLERAFPHRFGRPESSTFSTRQARQLLQEVVQILRDEVKDETKRDRIDGRIRAAFEYGIHVHCQRKRSSNALRRAIETFERKDKDDAVDPLAQLGFPFPNFDDIFKAGRFTPSDPKPQNPNPPAAQPAPPRENARPTRDHKQPTMSEVVQTFADSLSPPPQSPLSRRRRRKLRKQAAAVTRSAPEMDTYGDKCHTDLQKTTENTAES